MAAVECAGPDACHAVGNSDVCQARTRNERILTDVGNAVLNRDTRYTLAAGECIVMNACDRLRNRVVSGFTSRELNNRGAILIEQDAVNAAIFRVG